MAMFSFAHSAKNVSAWLAAVMVLVLLSAGGCKKEKAVVVQPPPLVTVATAISRDVPLYIDEIGNCESPEAVDVRPQISGQILNVHFVDGADVTKGDKLYTIDKRPYQAAYDQAVATLAVNKASLELAEADFKRADTLLPLKAISKEDFDTRKSTVDVDKAQILAAQAAAEAAKVNLDYCDIFSPVTGRAGKNLVDAGNVVAATGGASNTVLVSIQRLDQVYVNFTITEAQLAQVRDAMAAATLDTIARLPAEPLEKARHGGLTFLDNAVQQDTGTVALRATLANADRHFWPGQFVNVRLVLRTLKDAVLIPQQAMQISQRGPYVYVVKADKTAEIRPVKPGQRHGDMVVVLEGLRADETVVTDGQFLIYPGQPVAVKSAAQAMPGGTGFPGGAAQAQKPVPPTTTRATSAESGR